MATAKRREPSRVEGRICASCDGLIVQWRPVFLVGDLDNRILGPYHASCAEKIAIQRKRTKDRVAPVGDLLGRVVPKGSEGEGRA